MSVKFEDLPPLEENCDKCGGTGKDRERVFCGRSYVARCYDCGGKGSKPSPFGEAICNLITKYNPLAEEIAEVRRYASGYENDH